MVPFGYGEALTCASKQFQGLNCKISFWLGRQNNQHSHCGLLADISMMKEHCAADNHSIKFKMSFGVFKLDKLIPCSPDGDIACKS